MVYIEGLDVEDLPAEIEAGIRGGGGGNVAKAGGGWGFRRG